MSIHFVLYCRNMDGRERNKSCKAIILSVKQSGENNRSVCILSQERGLFDAILYGGPKNHLRSFVQPFNSGNLYIYEDKVKKSIKISDFDVTNAHPSFRTSIYKMWAANLAAEIIIKTKYAGEAEKAFILLKAFTDGLEASNEEESRLGMLRFLWRYTILLGLQIDCHTCISCGESLLKKSLNQESLSLFIKSQNGFSCSECMNQFLQTDEIISGGKFIMDNQSLTYLEAIRTLSPGKVRLLKISASSAFRMKIFLFHVIEEACGCRLKTLETGLGIL